MNLNRQNYRAWLINPKDFPAEGSEEEQIKFLCGYGILAPSVHNTQPWLFEISRSTLLIKPNLSSHLEQADHDDRGLYMALGACAENIIRAADYFGLSTDTMIGDGNVLIKFAKKRHSKSDESELISIVERHSNKLEYTKKPIPQKVLEILESIDDFGADLKIVTDHNDIDRIVTIHLDAAKATAENAAFVRELVKWIRPNYTSAGDGMPGFVSGTSTIKSLVGKAVLKKKPDILKKVVKQDESLLRSASAFAIFGVNEDSKVHWINCGRAFESFWLRATTQGLVAHPHAASVMDKKANKQLAKVANMSSLPVFLMRVGYSTKTDLRTPRKPL